jgi:octaprenyl-diphosphate synthase
MPKKTGKTVVADLSHRSEKGLALAKKMMLHEKMNHPKLRQALEHYFSYWNDFTHAGFFSVACEATAKGKAKEHVATQAAIALLAAAFDIHDDLLDKSKTKKETPTVYGKFGPEMTLLLGNAFLIQGFDLLAQETALLPKKNGDAALRTLKKLLFEVGNAHAMEVGLKETGITLDDYEKITEMKAASIEADMYLGAVFGGAPDSQIKVMARFGRILGMLATFRDDIIDVFDPEELSELISAGDLPLPLLFAMQHEPTRKRMEQILAKDKFTGEDIAMTVNLALESAPVSEIKNRMRLLIEEGSLIASKIQTTKLEKPLQALLSFMVEDLQS